MILLLGANAVLLATNGSDSYGDRGLLQRIGLGIKGIFTDEEQVSSSDDIEESIVISEASDIKKQ